MLPPADSVLEASQRKAMVDHPVPAFGHTRCYWALLDADLRYLYLDPTCFVHMGEQAAAVIGTCLLDYVHPAEQHSARADLRNVLDSRTLNGSVTRVRFARLSRIRVILGCAAPAPFPDADIVTEDERYIACDVVINWVSENVVLCFLHAIIDKGKADNDEQHKTQWTNWCGTSAMTTDHAAELHNRLSTLIPSPRGPVDRIFQLLINQPARPILFSWPPEGYSADEFGKLAHRMQIGGDDIHPRREDSAKTSCTRRYKATQQVADAGVLKEVDSIFIPHGAVIFACHKVVSSRRHSDPTRGRSNISDMYQHSYSSRPHHPMSHYPPSSHQAPGQTHYDQDARPSASSESYSPAGVPDPSECTSSRGPTSYPRSMAEYDGPHYGPHPEMREMDYGGSYGGHQYGTYPVQQRSPNYRPAQQRLDDTRSFQARPNEWGYAPPPPSSSQTQPWSASSKPSGNTNGAGYDSQPWIAAQGWNQGSVEQHSHQPMGYQYHTAHGTQLSPPQPQAQPLSPPPYAQDVPITQPPPHPDQSKREVTPQEETTAIPRVHAAPKRKRDTESRRDTSDKDGAGQPSPPGKEVIARERGQSAAATSRVGGGPPPGVVCCTSCKSETSPEWRKGPSGKKDLCNACGLRYARSKQKKDGPGAAKRRREKDAPLAPAPALAPPRAPRRSAPSTSAAVPDPGPNGTPTWTNVGTSERAAKRARSGTMTTLSQSPSPPHSESLAQSEQYAPAYDPQYGQNTYHNGYQNGYDEYAQIPESYGRGQAPAFAGP